ncbi:MAG: hypothetical protein GIKADHBN_00898 [Phycisphaerales bacterium]|nr:hypothetical protein [Phycisphaerales bacterium]
MTSASPDRPSQRPYPTCREVLDFLMSYLDEELSPDQRHEFDRHLAVCPSCVNYLESYKTAVRLGKAVMVDPEQAAEEVVPESLLRAIREARTK